MKPPSRLLVAGLCLALAACAVGSSPRPEHVYTLMGGTGSTAGPSDRAAAGSHGTLILRLAQVAAAPWLLRDDIYYRLAYHDASRIAPYAEARWVSPAPRMLEALAAEALDRTRAWKAVIGPGDDAAADVTLRLQVLELVQEFTSPSQSYGVLRARATLTDARSRAVIAQHAFAYRLEAPTPDAPGGVEAESHASRRLVSDVARWCAELDLPRGSAAAQGSAEGRR